MLFRSILCIGSYLLCLTDTGLTYHKLTAIELIEWVQVWYSHWSRQKMPKQSQRMRYNGIQTGHSTGHRKDLINCCRLCFTVRKCSDVYHYVAPGARSLKRAGYARHGPNQVKFWKK
jgi:hypothetical protein